MLWEARLDALGVDLDALGVDLRALWECKSVLGECVSMLWELTSMPGEWICSLRTTTSKQIKTLTPLIFFLAWMVN